MSTALSPHIDALLRDLRTRLEDLYGGRLHAVVLYGYARGEATPDSDVDVTVVLEGEVDAWAEIQRMSEDAYEVSSSYEELVTIYPVARSEFESTQTSVVSVARADGVRA